MKVLKTRLRHVDSRPSCRALNDAPQLSAARAPWRAWLLVVAALWMAFAPAWAASASFAPSPSSLTAYQATEYEPAPLRADARGQNSRLGFLAENALFDAPRASTNHGTASGSESARLKTAPGVCIYLYAHADPVNGIDPSGYATIIEQIGLIGAQTMRFASPVINTLDKVSRAKEFVDTLMVIQHQLQAFYSGNIGGAALQSALQGKAGEAVGNLTAKFFKPSLVKKYGRIAKQFAKAKNVLLERFLHIPADQVYKGAKGIPVVYIGGATSNDRPLTGDREDDFRLANRMAGFGSGARSHPSKYTWHHPEMMGVMVLVKKDWHRKHGHIGGAAVYKWYYGEGYED